MGGAMSCKEGKLGHSNSSNSMDNGKYVRYTPEQVEALERLYHECPKPSSLRRQQLIRECPILSNIEPKQIKVWFQNRRYSSLAIFLPKPGLLPSDFVSKSYPKREKHFFWMS